MVYPNTNYLPAHHESLIWHLENGVGLSPDRKLITISDNPLDIKHIGLRFNDDVYFFLS